jgi:hypothetical protein
MSFGYTRDVIVLTQPAIFLCKVAVQSYLTSRVQSHRASSGKWPSCAGKDLGRVQQKHVVEARTLEVENLQNFARFLHEIFDI